MHMALVKEELQKLKEESEKGCPSFLKFVYYQYTPAKAKKKINLSEEMLAEENLKRTISIKFVKIFHPDKNVSAPRTTQLLSTEIMAHLNAFSEKLS